MSRKKKSTMFVHRSELVSQVFTGKLADYMNQLRNSEPPIDHHRQRAAEHFGVAYEDVTPAQRRIGKSLNYGAWYK